MPACPPDFRLDSREVGNVTVVEFPSGCVLSGPRAEAAAAELEYLVEFQERTRLLLDFANVASLTSPMIGGLFVLHRKAHFAGGRLALCGVSLLLREILEIAKLTHFVRIYEDEQEALRSF
jgi:anti-anti-sigma regulatory factor